MATMQHLASLSLPLGSAASSSGPGASRHHMLPSSLSPAMDLALVFTTTAPSAAAPAAAPTLPNQAGLSAAQRLIQQRMAMMRARAAAAAGLATSSALGEDASGPVKGQPVQMTLWRTGSGTEVVWQKSVTVPDALFGRDGASLSSSRPHQTLEVAGMQWSPDGRRIAVHIIASRAESSGKSIISHSLLATYNIQNGTLLKLVPLSQAASPDLLPRKPAVLAWTKLHNRRSPYTRSARSLRHGIVVSGVASYLEARSKGSAGPGGHARFQQYAAGGSGKGSGREQRDIDSLLPSLKGLDSEHAAAQSGEEDEEGGDYLRGWYAQPEDQELSMLAVPGYKDGRQGIHLLLYARIPIAFVPLEAQAKLLAAHILPGDDGGDDQRGGLLMQSRGGDSPSLFHHVVRLPHLNNPTDSLLRLMSELHASSAQLLDHACMLRLVFSSLTTPAPADLRSLSEAQLASLPPLRRFTWTLARLAAAQDENVKASIVTALATGTYTAMVESMLLNTFSESKWRVERDAIVEAYKVVEFVAAELLATCSDTISQLCELKGWAGLGDCPLLAPCVDEQGAYLERQISAISLAQASALQIAQYAQGERLAWDEMDKWVRWERDRLEGIKSDNQDPLDAKTFDPVVVTELVMREFSCKELTWILLGVRDEGGALDAGKEDGEGDETEESFQVARRHDEIGAKHNESTAEDTSVAGLSMAESKASKTRPSLQASLEKSLDWLRIGKDSQAAVAPPVAPPRQADPFEHLFQSGHLPNSDDRPAVYAQQPLEKSLRSSVLAIKAAFMGVNERMSEECEILFKHRETEADLHEDKEDDDAIVSLPTPRSQSVEADGSSRNVHARSIVCSGSGRLITAILVLPEGQTILLKWHDISEGADGRSTGPKMRLRSSFIERMEIMDEERLFCVCKDETSTPNSAAVRYLECFSLSTLYSMAQSLTGSELERDALEAHGALLYRQTLGAAEEWKGSIALSSGRNTAGLLQIKKGEPAAASTATLDLWDVSAAEGEEDETMQS